MHPNPEKKVCVTISVYCQRVGLAVRRVLNFLGKTKVPDSAAFPHGLPEEALEATVAPYPSSESVSSDSDHGGRHQFTFSSIVSSV